ncbi:hypothetical protein [Amycolatopsis thermophila]|uniref:Secreted protein n=1 Tax=Amycolatopsis thermophila TaxID=206084 RepID=A0ABU0ETI5_9PSEU|nr:hypothetical protein [Amycolatopsis thermophila]MDQ0378583.1 hypothetical protein [Amycolatopsis thermophila]
MGGEPERLTPEQRRAALVMAVAGTVAVVGFVVAGVLMGKAWMGLGAALAVSAGTVVSWIRYGGSRPGKGRSGG